MAGHIDHVTRARPTNGGEEHATDLYLSNLDDVWPHWKAPGGGPQQINLDGTRPRYEPWPDELHQLLLWLATSKAEPWIPTLPELEKLWQQRKNRANPNPTKVPGIRRPPLNRPLPIETTRLRVSTVIENR